MPASSIPPSATSTPPANTIAPRSALDPGNPKAALNLAKSKRFAGQPDEDEDRIRAAAEHGAEDDAAQRDLHLALGKIDDDRGEWESAFAHYERANRPHAAAAHRQVDDSLALMDRLRTVFDAGWFAARPAAAAADPTPVFVVGMPRSGTSLVEQCLGRAVGRARRRRGGAGRARLLTLDYEALVADPEPYVRRMVAYVGLEWDDACLSPHEVARTVRTASAWQVRQPVYQRSAGRAQAYERYMGSLREGLGEAVPGEIVHARG